MKELEVYLEINSELVLVGEICGNSYMDASFTYCEEYLRKEAARPISFSLPLKSEPFSKLETRNYFEGLLPEGFSRRAVANYVKVSEDDYLAILESLGRECLGALVIINKGEPWVKGEYIKLSEEEVAKLAAEGASKSTEILTETHLSLTGASGKVGLYYDEKEKTWYLPKGIKASTHIVKQSHVRLERIVLNEFFCMNVAKKLGIDIPETFIVNIGDGKDSEVLFATKRYDRKLAADGGCTENHASPMRLHQEDFCQALGIPASEKYEHDNQEYMKKMFELIRRVSSNPLEDQLKLWDMIVVNYLIGNTDCHIKYYSLIYSENLKSVRLAPAYDIVCTIAYQTTKQMSFSIGGEYDITRINRESFEKAAREVGIGVKIALERFDRLSGEFGKAVDEVAVELSGNGYRGVDDIKKTILRTAP